MCEALLRGVAGWVCRETWSPLPALQPPVLPRVTIAPGKSRSGDGFKPLAAPTFWGFSQAVLNPKFLLSLNATRGSRLCPSTKQEVNIFPLIYWFNFILLLQMLPLCPRTLVWGSFLGTVISTLTVLLFLVGRRGWKAEYI